MIAKGVTGVDLANAIGVSYRRVQIVRSENKLPLTDDDDIDIHSMLKTAWTALLAAGRGGQPDDDNPTLAAEKLRLTREQADKVALENVARRGELIPRETLMATVPAMARRYADAAAAVIRDTVTDDDERAIALERLFAATEDFIGETGGAATVEPTADT